MNIKNCRLLKDTFITSPYMYVLNNCSLLRPSRHGTTSRRIPISDSSGEVPSAAIQVGATLGPLNAGLTDSGSTLSVPGFPNAITTAPSGRQEKIYTGLIQVLCLDNAEEDAHSLYGGLSAHLMRVVPIIEGQRCRDVHHLRRYPSVGCLAMTRIIIYCPS